MSSTVTPRRSQAERSATTRAALVDAAVEVLTRVNPAAMRLSDVAAEAGLSKGAVQHHFASKSDLFDAVVDHGLGKLATGLESFTALDGTLSERVSAAVDLLWEAYSCREVIAAFAVAASRAAGGDVAEWRRDVSRFTGDLMDEEWAAVFDDAPAGPAVVSATHRYARAQFVGLLTYSLIDPEVDEPTVELELLKQALVAILGG